MIHQYVKNDASGDHWAVAADASRPLVLAQLQEGGTQVRLALTPEQADAMAAQLVKLANRARALSPDRNTPSA